MLINEDKQLAKAMGFDVRGASDSDSDTGEEKSKEEDTAAFDKDAKEESGGLEKQIQEFVLKFTAESSERLKKQMNEQKEELEERIEKDIRQNKYQIDSGLFRLNDIIEQVQDTHMRDYRNIQGVHREYIKAA